MDIDRVGSPIRYDMKASSRTVRRRSKMAALRQEQQHASCRRNHCLTPPEHPAPPRPPLPPLLPSPPARPSENSFCELERYAGAAVVESIVLALNAGFGLSDNI